MYSLGDQYNYYYPRELMELKEENKEKEKEKKNKRERRLNLIKNNKIKV